MVSLSCRIIAKNQRLIKKHESLKLSRHNNHETKFTPDKTNYTLTEPHQVINKN